jgi:nitrous oxidase accessory protein
MSKLLGSVAIVLFLIYLIITPLKGEATPNTIIVPDNYPTIQQAIDNAASGATILVRAGTYNQTQLLCNKTIKLIGEGESKTQIILHPPTINLTIAGYDFSYPDAAINFTAGNTVIAGFKISSDRGSIKLSGNNDQIEQNQFLVGVTLTGNNDVLAYNTLDFFSNPTYGIGIMGSYGMIYGNTGVGLLSGGSFNSFVGNILNGELGSFGTDNSNVFYNNTLNGGVGMSAQSNDVVAFNTVTNCNHGIIDSIGSNIIVYGNSISSCRGAGLAKIEGLNNLFYANLVKDNAVGVQIGAGGSIMRNGVKELMGNSTFYTNNFEGNNQQVQVLVPSPTDDWNFSNKGNYWSDYVGADADNDGIGDTPYNTGDDVSDYLPLMAPYDISNVALQLPAWAQTTKPNLILIPDFPPQPAPSSSPNSTQDTFANPTTIPSSTVEQTTIPHNLLYSITTFAIVFLIVLLAVASISLVYFKRRNSHPLSQQIVP